ncbi:MAG: hypothetical protein ABIQ01_02185 [Pseudolysinimonas sp.]
MIKPDDLTGVAEDLARRILVTARSIAPCLDSLEDEAGEDTPKLKSDAIAILKGIAKSGGRSHLLKSQRVGPAAVEYNAGSWWADDDRAALRSLCALASTGGLPIGEFPATSKALTRMWPEDC